VRHLQTLRRERLSISLLGIFVSVGAKAHQCLLPFDSTTIVSKVQQLEDLPLKAARAEAGRPVSVSDRHSTKSSVLINNAGFPGHKWAFATIFRATIQLIHPLHILTVSYLGHCSTACHIPRGQSSTRYATFFRRTQSYVTDDAICLKAEQVLAS
jgi:hypothetical protein